MYVIRDILWADNSSWLPQFYPFPIPESNDPTLKLIACPPEKEETDFLYLCNPYYKNSRLRPGGRSWIYHNNLISEEKRDKMTELNSPATLSCRVTQTIASDYHSLICHHAP